MSQGYIDKKGDNATTTTTTTATFIPHSSLSDYMDDNGNTVKTENNKQASTLDLDSILKSIFQPTSDNSQRDQTGNPSNPSSRRHSVAVGELDLHGMDSTWLNQQHVYPMDDLNFSTMDHFNQISHQHQDHQFHRRAMSMQQSDGFISHQQHTSPNNHYFDHNNNKDTLAEFHPTSTSFAAAPSDFTNNILMNLDLFHSPNDVVPTWLLSNTTSSTTTTHDTSSPPLSVNINSGGESATTSLDSNEENQQSPLPKTKRQKKSHSTDKMIGLEPILKQENPFAMQNHPLQLSSAASAIMTPDAIRSFVQRYISEQYGERTVMLLTSRVAQKSYGTEKRFLCPPPTTVLSGSWCIQVASDPSSPTTTSPTSMQPRLTIQISGENNQQSGTLEWSTPPPPVLPSALVSSEGFLHSSSSTIGKCVSKQLHINDADEKRKRVQVLVNIQLGNNENIGTFASKGIKVISKPSKKRQSLKNIDLCIHHGTTISLFNRIRSQTVSTKYLGVSSQPTSSPSSSASSTNNSTPAASNCCFVARTNVWDPFVIWIVDPQRTQHSVTALPDNGTNAHRPPPPAMALHHTGKEQLAVHYNQPIVLQCLTTGLVSPVMYIRKVDKGSLALSGMMVMDPSLSSTTEALGDPVSQLHKVAFEIKSLPSTTTKVPPPSPSPSHLYQQQQQQQHRNIFLACLNDVVGRHKCHHPPRPVASTVKNTASQQQQQQQDLTTTPAPSSGHGGRRRSSAASSSLDQIDHSQGAYYEQDVSDAAVWTLVGTDTVRFTFAVPPPSQDTNCYMRPDIAPFPVVSSVSQGDATLCLWGEAFTTQLTVYVGDLALSTEFKSPEALVCVIPSSLLSSSPGLAVKKQPILLVRNDGVIYKTNHFWNK